MDPVLLAVAVISVVFISLAILLRGKSDDDHKKKRKRGRGKKKNIAVDTPIPKETVKEETKPKKEEEKEMEVEEEKEVVIEQKQRKGNNKNNKNKKGNSTNTNAVTKVAKKNNYNQKAKGNKNQQGKTTKGNQKQNQNTITKNAGGQAQTNQKKKRRNRKKKNTHTGQEYWNNVQSLSYADYDALHGKKKRGNKANSRNEWEVVDPRADDLELAKKKLQESIDAEQRFRKVIKTQEREVPSYEQKILRQTEKLAKSQAQFNQEKSQLESEIQKLQQVVGSNFSSKDELSQKNYTLNKKKGVQIFSSPELREALIESKRLKKELRSSLSKIAKHTSFLERTTIVETTTQTGEKYDAGQVAKVEKDNERVIEQLRENIEASRKLKTENAGALKRSKAKAKRRAKNKTPAALNKRLETQKSLIETLTVELAELEKKVGEMET
eukprot:TRINITY_DN2741_c0_g1_i1.p1 TRINITY_DN2741_c0_g1~~TRINITY_DN2741_c0_g1_i1.p1  ORF type:complete len:439 (+),score=133.76 TRINITY_DN2741_c0_g1_i1:95-1411(+)